MNKKVKFLCDTWVNDLLAISEGTVIQVLEKDCYTYELKELNGKLIIRADILLTAKILKNTIDID